MEFGKFQKDLYNKYHVASIIINVNSVGYILLYHLIVSQSEDEK